MMRSTTDVTIRTELQIIILLEILAISTKFTPALLDGTKVVAEITDKKERKKEKKARKGKLASKTKDDTDFIPEPPVHLDLLVDRLCIWQLMEDDLDPEDAPSSQHTKDDHDHIQHFCVEVIMTLYV